jgi:inner membrane protein
MASIGHIAIGMAAARAERPMATTASLAVAMFSWSLISLLPDADVLGFPLGVPYAHAWGHRGVAHSFAFLACVALGIALVARAFRQSALRTGLVAALVLISHPLLDTLTDGGLGCALLWPFADTRYFAPLRPIPVAPIGAAFLTRAGLRVASVELVLFAPLFFYALWPRARRTCRKGSA